MAKINPKDVYSASNIQNTLTNPAQNPMDMKLEKLEKTIDTAKSQAELQNAQIMNQPVAMPIITGQAGHMANLWNARINTLTNAYNTKMIQMQREEAKKEAEKQAFMSEWGVDPSTRPSGMSKSEFKKKLISQGVMPMSQYNQIKMKQSLKTGGGSGSNKIQSGVQSLLTQAANMPTGGREWAANVASQLYGEEGINMVNTFTAQDGWEQAFGAQPSQDYETEVQNYALALQGGQITAAQIPMKIRGDVLAVVGQGEGDFIEEPQKEEGLLSKFKSWWSGLGK